MHLLFICVSRGGFSVGEREKGRRERELATVSVKMEAEKILSQRDGSSFQAQGGKEDREVGMPTDKKKSRPACTSPATAAAAKPSFKQTRASLAFGSVPLVLHYTGLRCTFNTFPFIYCCCSPLSDRTEPPLVRSPPHTRQKL